MQLTIEAPGKHVLILSRDKIGFNLSMKEALGKNTLKALLLCTGKRKMGIF
jgi:hypothetical protein